MSPSKRHNLINLTIAVAMAVIFAIDLTRILHK
jgi:hypothetical protein